MREIFTLEPIAVPPSRALVLRAQGIPPDREVPERVEELVEAARALYQTLSEPRGMVATLSHDEFAEIYEGEGHNSFPSPVPAVAERCDHLAFFCATLGDPVCDRIKDLFSRNDPALGYTLDTIASDRADAAADFLAETWRQALIREFGSPEGITVLPYSPGYCGWHVTGQRRLFAFLKPGDIGVTLNDSCLMHPIKSVSGVLLAGAREAHDFANDFDFCVDCATWDCRNRISSLFEPPND